MSACHLLRRNETYLFVVQEKDQLHLPPMHLLLHYLGADPTLVLVRVPTPSGVSREEGQANARSNIVDVSHWLGGKRGSNTSAAS